MNLSIDINADLGELDADLDAAMMPFISSASIACGFHAGSPTRMRETVLLCLKFGVAIGAHPSYYDRTDFGRRELGLDADTIYSLTLYQIGALKAMVAAEPDAELFIHPECGCATSAMYLASSGVVPKERTKILSTSGMITAAKETRAAKVLVATETGMLHQLRKANPLVIFEPVNRAAVCKYMKMNTPEKLLEALRTGRDEVTVPRDIADRARLSVERMIAIGTPSRTKE